MFNKKLIKQALKRIKGLFICEHRYVQHSQTLSMAMDSEGNDDLIHYGFVRKYRCIHCEHKLVTTTKKENDEFVKKHGVKTLGDDSRTIIKFKHFVERIVEK